MSVPKVEVVFVVTEICMYSKGQHFVLFVLTQDLSSLRLLVSLNGFSEFLLPNAVSFTKVDKTIVDNRKSGYGRLETE